MAPTPQESLPQDLDSLDVQTLEALVRHHNHLYWDKHAPAISDTDYDRLVRRLKTLAPSSPVLTEMGPQQDDVGRFGAPVRHKRPMLSLDKCYGDDELREWSTTFHGDAIVSPKFDGIACSLWYDENGDLSLATTRGDGLVGDDITANARTISDIPKKIDRWKGREIEIRGEVFMRLSVFAGYKDKFANPRNLTAGAIKQKDPKKCAAYNLSFAGYELLGADLASEADKLDALTALGFDPFERKVVPQDKIVDTYREFAEKRPTFDFEIDGVVFKVNRVDEQKRLGYTSHHPRYAIAYKFQGDSGTTKLRGVEWSVARTGAITPVALIDPVMLSGALVGRASLHHPGYVAKLGLTQNAEVLVTRRGGVIPNLEHVTKPGDLPLNIPTSCPSCGGEVRWEGDFLLCAVPANCRAARMGLIAHFVAVVGIDGFGDRIIGELYDRELVRSPADLYKLEVKQLTAIERVGEKLAKKLVGEVQAHRQMPLETFLRSLGIDELGKHVAKILATEFVTLPRVLAITPAELSAIHSIGEVIARSVTQGLVSSRPLIDALLTSVTIIEADATPGHVDAQAGTGPFAGLSFVFTGKMARLERKEAQDKVLRLGGQAPDSVVRTTSYLVVGDDKADGKKSSKEKTADKLVAQGAPLKIISESDFIVMVEAAEAKPS